MSVLSTFRESLGLGPSAVSEAERIYDGAVALRQESYSYVSEGLSHMTQLSLALEERGWLPAGGFGTEPGTALSFEAIQSAAANARALAIGNPLMTRAVESRGAFVWGQGVKITGLGRLEKSRSVRRVLTDTEAQERLDFEKATTGNVLVLVNDDKTLEVIPFHQITGAIYDPQDSSKIWYFHRRWEVIYTDYETGDAKKEIRRGLYRNYDYEAPREIDRNVDWIEGEDGSYIPYYTPRSIRGVPIYQDGVIRHLASHRMEGSAWGIPDVLAGIFYATEHKELIEAADSVFRAQSQYAITWKAKTKKQLTDLAASVAGPMPVDPNTGKPMEYGRSIGMGADVEMQLMQKIGAGIDFSNFDPIANLASVSLGLPVDIVLGKEERNTTLPFTTKASMRKQQRIWSEFIRDIGEMLGKTGVKAFFPKIDPDPAHRQMQTITGAAALKLHHPDQIVELINEMFEKDDWDDKAVDPEEWADRAQASVVPGSTEIGNDGQPITGGQGQTGQVGKLSDGDHELRDEGGQAHTDD